MAVSGGMDYGKWMYRLDDCTDRICGSDRNSGRTAEKGSERDQLRKNRNRLLLDKERGFRENRKDFDHEG